MLETKWMAHNSSAGGSSGVHDIRWQRRRVQQKAAGWWRHHKLRRASVSWPMVHRIERGFFLQYHGNTVISFPSPLGAEIVYNVPATVTLLAPSLGSVRGGKKGPPTSKISMRRGRFIDDLIPCRGRCGLHFILS
jgi:hypothetical protein